jgi:hypothetical protein
MTSLLQKINELDYRIDNINISGGGDTTALQAQVDTNTSDISGIQIDKQDKLTAGDNITIMGDVISASGGGSVSGSSTDVVGFRAAGDGTFFRDVNRYTYLSGSLKVYDNQEHSTFDTHSGYQANAYTIPTGYGGRWDLNLKNYMFNYRENATIVSIQKGSEIVLQSGDYQGQLADFSSIIKVEEGDQLRVYQEVGTGRYWFNPNRSWWSMRFISSSIYNILYYIRDHCHGGTINPHHP